MGIFNEFFKKEKPVFTGLKFGFGFGAGAAGGPTVGPVATGGGENLVRWIHLSCFNGIPDYFT